MARADSSIEIALRGLRLWDGQQLLDADTIVLRQTQIAAIGNAADLINAQTRVLDCAGLWAIPGLIDGHVHLELDPEDRHAPTGSQAHQQPRMLERAAKMVAAGITTARDLGGSAWMELALRDGIATGTCIGPRLLCSGQPITTPTGHCHFWGGAASDPAQVQAVLDRQVAHGVDLIKVMATGGRMTKGSRPMAAQFDAATLSAIVQRASGFGLPVAAHCHGTEGIEAAAQAGVSTIEHCSWVGEQGWASDYQQPIAELILKRGIWVSPTINRGWQRMLDARDGTTLSRVRSAYRAMRALGIPLLASTDAGIPGVFHQDLAHALAVFAQIAELSPEETLKSATSNAAIALGIESITGRLQPGLSADLLLLSDNPLTNLRTLTEPVAVWARGRCVLNRQ